MENKKIMKEEVLEKIIRSVKSKDLPNSYSSELHLKLLQTKREMHQHNNKISDIISNLRYSLFKPVFVSVTTFLLFLIIGGYFYFQGYVKGIKTSQGQVTGSVISSVLNMGTEGVLRINFSSPKEQKDINFEILLPEGLCLVQNAKINCSDKIINWNGNLNLGKNVIKLPIMATHEGVWEIYITAKKGNTVKNIKRSVS